MRYTIIVLAASLVIGNAIDAQQRDSLSDTARVAAVVVTATRAPLPRDRVPASVTVLDGAVLRSQGLTHLVDALRLVPGTAVVQSGSYGAQTSLFMRGGQGNYTKVLIDGVPVNEPGGTLDVGTLTLDNVDRIEVVRGPTSVLYGSDAVTGVVQIFTHRGQGAQPHASLDAHGGSYGSYDVSGSVDAGFEESRLSVGAAHHATSGIYRFNSEYRNDVVTATLGLAPWRSAELRATGRYTDVTAHFPTDFTGAPVDPNAFRTDKRTMLGAEVRQHVGSLSARLALTSNLTDAATINPPNDAQDVESTQRGHLVRQAADLSMNVPFAAVGSATFGATVERQRQALPDTGRRNTAAYVELLRSGGLTTVAVGARLDHSGTFGDFGTYRVSLARVLPAAMRLRANIGTAFREPAFYETFATAFSNANPDLRPERTTSWEVGVEKRFAMERFTLGATYFSQRFVDLIDYHVAATGSVYENVARARASGAEGELRAVLAPAVTVDAGYTYLDTRVLERGFSTSPLATLVAGGPLLRRPKHSTAAGISFHGTRRQTLDLRATYVGKRADRRFHGAPNFETDAVVLDPYTKVDVAATLPLASIAAPLRPIVASLRVDNVFDTRYESVAGYATPRRVILAGLRAEF